jgi:hypothetical protein
VQRLPVLTALIGGVVLSILVMTVGGYLAAVAWPQWFSDFARANVRTAMLASDTVLFVLPIGLLAFAFGFALFRLLRSARAGLVVAVVAAYFMTGILVEIFSISAWAEDPFVVWARLWSDPAAWYRLSAVPAALTLAAYGYVRAIRA